MGFGRWHRVGLAFSFGVTISAFGVFRAFIFSVITFDFALLCIVAVQMGFWHRVGLAFSSGVTISAFGYLECLYLVR